jgi:hypothetical protein
MRKYDEQTNGKTNFLIQGRQHRDYSFSPDVILCTQRLEVMVRTARHIFK